MTSCRNIALASRARVEGFDLGIVRFFLDGQLYAFDCSGCSEECISRIQVKPDEFIVGETERSVWLIPEEGRSARDTITDTRPELRGHWRETGTSEHPEWEKELMPRPRHGPEYPPLPQPSSFQLPTSPSSSDLRAH
ncbi:hypothetical protein LshimejAT787_2000080 [Lyophyllum shimeji]|uniref:Uncharacterized protein n=1 Tax=Lyophyllum shimeji TaxID=47721 RepID=A0A9P3PZZ3_LYOSH|nr:hypothetical protein LshimejAT787_2000080 [Lyophyllum shimeji]